LFFGSSFRNFQRDAWAAFLRILPLRPGSGDTLLLAMDHVNDKGKIDAAHNDSQGYGGACVMNVSNMLGGSWATRICSMLSSGNMPM
ncbi:hypothetical protein K523DRAFT_389864, partial [Schizophyllum commune Tattone D]